MAKATVELPGIEIDFSDAIVEKATASRIDLELKVKDVVIPNRKLKSVLVRFEGIKDFERIWYELNTKVRKSRRTEIHDPWPLALPARLKTLIEVKSQAKLRKFRFAVAEEHFRGRKKPLEFSCKRFSVTDLKGQVVAGDVSKISSSKQWKKKDYLDLAERFALAVENADLKTAHSLLASKAAKSTSLSKFRKQFESYVSSDRKLDRLMKNYRTKKSFKHRLADDLAIPDILPKRVDLDDVIAVVHTPFLGWFTVNLVLTERSDSLKVLDFTLTRDWVEYF